MGGGGVAAPVPGRAAHGAGDSGGAVAEGSSERGPGGGEEGEAGGAVPGVRRGAGQGREAVSGGRRVHAGGVLPCAVRVDGVAADAGGGGGAATCQGVDAAHRGAPRRAALHGHGLDKSHAPRAVTTLNFASRL